MAENNENLVISDEPTNKALNQYPFMFDSTELPFFPGDWGRTNSPLRNILQSEGGQDMVQTIRAKKISIPVNMAVSDDTWVGFFEEYSEKGSFTVKVYSPRIHDYDTLTMRMDDFSCKVHKKSEALTAVAGVWDISFTLVEL